MRLAHIARATARAKYAHDILDKTPEDVKLRTMGPSGA